jgi:hypothetical protein
MRAVAGALMFALAIGSAAECLVGAHDTPEHMACCAAMHGGCDMTVSAPCCASESQSLERVIAAKAAVVPMPAAVLVAVLSAPPVAMPAAGRFRAPVDSTSSSPPGVATYLFVASFRI